MNRSVTPSTRAAALALALAAACGSANALTITRDFSASWYDPTHAGHGFSVEVVDSAAGKTMVAYWYTFDETGKPLWVVAQGPVTGPRAVLQGVTAEGGSFGNDFGAGQVQVQPWGSIEVEFSDCNRGTVRWFPADPSLAAGSMPIERLTRLYGSACTGGISDDAGSGGENLLAEQFLAGTPPAAQSRARTRFEQLSDRTGYNLELEDLPVGTYAVRVGGAERGTVTVRAVPGGTQGEIEFRSPVESGKVLLDFDPRGQVIEVAQGATVFFSGTQVNGSAPPPPVVDGAPPTGNALYSVRFEPQNDGPQLEAELEQRADRVDFQVELEDVPAGTYTIRVGGTPRGSVSVVAVPGGTRGEIEYRNPVEPGKMLLDFDPRGALIEAVRDGVVAIAATLPATPTGTPDSGGGDDGGGTTPGTQSVPLSSTGVDSDANGSASYERTSNEQEFEVEVEDLADGAYSLLVGGVTRATITVSGSRGEVKFNNPPRAGRLLLDFDPRGQRIDVSRDGITYLTAQFPT